MPNLKIRPPGGGSALSGWVRGRPGGKKFAASGKTLAAGGEKIAASPPASPPARTPARKPSSALRE